MSAYNVGYDESDHVARQLEQAKPLIEDLLMPVAHSDNFVVALADARGHLTFVSGPSGAMRRAETIGFCPGQDWSPAQAGRNAPGEAVTLGEPVVVRGAEHTRDDVRPFSCSAAPLLDASGGVMGALDVTGGESAAHDKVARLVRATAAAIQREWQLTGCAQTLPRTTRLRLVSSQRPHLEVNGASYPLTERHTELLTVLATNPAGVSADELAYCCYPEGASLATVRVEMLRLRRHLDNIPDAPALLSRPYRLSEPVTVDALEVTALLSRGAHVAALDLYHPPETTHCTGAAQRLMTATSLAVRESVLSDGSTESVLRYLDLPEAQGDLDAWRTALRILPPDAPQRALIVARMESWEQDGRT